MRNFTVSLVQMDIRKGAPRVNWPVVQEHVATASQAAPDAIVLPELWDAGNAYKQGHEIASSLSGGLFAQVVALSRQHGVHIFGTLYEKRGQAVQNTLAVVSPRAGVMGAYRKIHLFPLAQEDKWLTHGEAPLAVDLPWGRSGFAICYDLRYPELFRRYARDGVEIVFVPMAWPSPRLDHFRTLIRARAIENQCYMVAVNRVGTDQDDGTHYFGHSCVINPWGEIVLETGETPGIYNVEIDLDMVTEVRRHLPALNGMRL